MKQVKVVFLESIFCTILTNTSLCLCWVLRPPVPVLTSITAYLAPNLNPVLTTAHPNNPPLGTVCWVPPSGTLPTRYNPMVLTWSNPIWCNGHNSRWSALAIKHVLLINTGYGRRVTGIIARSYIVPFHIMTSCLVCSFSPHRSLKHKNDLRSRKVVALGKSQSGANGSSKLS